MRRRFRVVFFALLVAAGLACVDVATTAQAPANNDTNTKATLLPAVATLLRDATAAYQKMHSYQHTAEFLVRSEQEADKITAYTLALERPNKFAYRSDNADEAAAVCDGKFFINYRSDDSKYTRVAAPLSFKQINIVDDVTFNPVGTYIIALMLQGDALADEDVRTCLAAASAPKTVTEDGVRYETIESKFGPGGIPLTLYFNAQTHLLHKTIEQNEQSHIKVTEIIENVKIDKPIPASVFQYTPPKNAQWLTLRGAKLGRQRLVASN